MSYTHDVNFCLEEFLGEGGLKRQIFDEQLASCAQSLVRLKEDKDSGRLPFLSIPEEREDLVACQSLVSSYRDNCSDVIVLGTGGSSLGGRTLYGLANSPFGPVNGGPRLHFVDNIDPYSFAVLLKRLDISTTGLITLSKSGSTAETVAQFMALLPAFQKAYGPDKLAERVTIITEPKPNPLRKLARDLGLECLDQNPLIGGRFCLLTIVGLLPAMIAGLDVNALREAAAKVVHQALNTKDMEAIAPVVGASVATGLLRQRNISQTVIMPYEDRLADLGLWYNQLWAESLGKEGKGTTPIRALGTVDQHSQLQLYLDGPQDKMFTMIYHDARGEGLPVDSALPDGEDTLSYLRGRTLGDLLTVSAEATAQTLAKNGRPVRKITLNQIDEQALGALTMHYMLETVIAADLLGVNPYDQPAVEQGKVLARRFLRDLNDNSAA
ncbi:glucose-6-phosphate isomerase [Kiloniella laminariae]|uniref:Glucose-6-phosphate isomerase n=1 Tax=Kiloniella laminariae TaxID=454162 RepID=A0ABT4LKZ2_9PROT|nr:glucose-6-phosphate isomerase [Kiloniella laminariae]MCZ4281744.1 glucose-6-phosphate isomerase [Kiloniella laminariae]